MSTTIGTAPRPATANAVAMNVAVGTMASSPARAPRRLEDEDQGLYVGSPAPCFLPAAGGFPRSHALTVPPRFMDPAAPLRDLGFRF